MLAQRLAVEKIRPVTWLLVAALLVAASAAGTTLFALKSEKDSLVALAAIGVMAGLAISGNARLFLLYGLLLLVPINLGKDFMANGHQGGAGSFTIDATDPFLLALAALQLRDWFEGYRQPYRIPVTALLWSALIVLGLGTIAFGVYRTAAAQEVLRMGKLLVLLLVLTNEVVRRRQFLHAANALLIGVLAEGTIALVQHAANLQLGLAFLGEETEKNIEITDNATLIGGAPVRRVGGLLGHPNLLSASMALLLPVGIALLLAPIRIPRKLLYSGAIILGLTALIFTLSRSGWIAFSAALMSVLALSFTHRGNRRRYILIRLTIITAIVVVGLAFSGQIVKRLLESNPSSFKVRLEFLRDARRAILDRPLLGLGLNSYVFSVAPYTRFQTTERRIEVFGRNMPVVHNVWALTWAEQGTIGFAFFVLLHLCVIAVGLGNLKIRDPTLHALNVGLLSGFGAVMIDGMASFFIRTVPGGRLFWTVTALILALGYWHQKTEMGKGTVCGADRPPDSPPLATGAGGWLPVRTNGFAGAGRRLTSQGGGRNISQHVRGRLK